MIPLLCTLALVGALLVLAGARNPRTVPARPGRTGDPAIAIGAAVVAAVTALIVTAVPAFACIAGAAAALLPGLVRRRRVLKAARDRAQAWPAMLDDVTSAVRAGMNLPEALSRAGMRAPDDVRPAFRSFDAQYARTGDFTGSIESLRVALDDRVFDQLARAIVMAREVGGHDLTQMLRSLGGYLRADLQIRGELLARQSWTVNSARMAVAAPWVVLVLLSTRPATVDAYRTFTGMLLLGCVACTSALAYAVMLRIARLEDLA